ncbi:hypothetical protein C2845_PM02G19630 [Panicum miliaceum]|uniref:Uncharacterized protein n=1 Tax=Panicum miliaceum TaxID=4540 RepID=A0A3L6SEY0_PANMI|nr:hypothetical protein C2845_PM02G19630 [Panicum miliaceum]
MGKKRPPRRFPHGGQTLAAATPSLPRRRRASAGASLREPAQLARMAAARPTRADPVVPFGVARAVERGDHDGAHGATRRAWGSVRIPAAEVAAPHRRHRRQWPRTAAVRAWSSLLRRPASAMRLAAPPLPWVVVEVAPGLLVLEFLEEMLRLGLFLAQPMALAATCVVHRRWGREHQAAEADLPATARLLLWGWGIKVE